jgi:hypothetical protein
MVSGSRSLVIGILATGPVLAPVNNYSSPMKKAAT